MTFDSQSGVCLSVRECYPYTKLHQLLSPLETWVIGTVGTCHFTIGVEYGGAPGLEPPPGQGLGGRAPPGI